MVVTILMTMILRVTTTMKTPALMMTMKSLKVPGREDVHSQKAPKGQSRKLWFPRTVPTFTEQCLVLRLAGFGKPEWHVVLMEFNDPLLLEFMQVTWMILTFPACSILNLILIRSWRCLFHLTFWRIRRRHWPRRMFHVHGWRRPSSERNCIWPEEFTDRSSE